MATSTSSREGIIVIALGSPTELTEESIAEFLGEFLADPRVVDWPMPLWKPILNNIVLAKRPAAIISQYEAIWQEGGSPLRIYTAEQVAQLRQLIPGALVREAYQYGHPNITEVYLELARECDRVTFIPTYPQFAPVTVGSVADRVHDAVEAGREAGLECEVRAVRSWAGLESYTQWYADQIAAALAEEAADMLVFSWHGVPDRSTHDPATYRAECAQTEAAIMEGLARRGVTDQATRTTFQSKFGPGTWLRPATIDTMAALPAEGVKSVLVATPGFFCDCLETTFEIGDLNRDEFMNAGGASFRRIEPPNGSAAAAQMLADVYHSLA